MLPPPPGLPTLLLFLLSTAPTNPFFHLFILMLHSHSLSLSLAHHLSVFLLTYPHGWSAEQRKGRGPVPAPVVSDSHKCVKEEKRKSYSLSSATPPSGSSFPIKEAGDKCPEMIRDHHIVQCLFVCEEGGVYLCQCGDREGERN